MSKCNIADSKSLTQKQSRLIADSRLCPLCGGRPEGLAFPFETIWEGRPYCYFCCGSCKTAFIDPTPKVEDLRKIYSKSNYHDEHYLVWDHQAIGDSLRRIRRALPGIGSILDFGCGTGGFLSAAKEQGLDSVGVEFDPEVAREASRRSGAPVVHIAELKTLGRTFDALRMADVLEHLSEPALLVRELACFIAAGGSLILEGPLQAHPSLVYWAASVVKGVKRLIGVDRPDTIAPAHLILTNGPAQRAFFTRFLGWNCSEFEIYEDGWPFLASGASNSAMGSLAKKTIGWAAIIASRADPRRNRLGNRCFGVFQP